MMRKLSILALVAAAVAIGQPAQATDLQWDGSGSTDHVNWGQLGPAFTAVPSGATATSAGGLLVTLTDSSGGMERVDQGNGWAGSFAPGEQLLWNAGDGTITISFASPVSAAGAQIQSDSYGDFLAMIMLNDGSSFTIGGNSNPNGGDTNPFLGAISNTANITGITFSMPTNGPSFAISDLLLIVPSAIPEPATWAMMMLGFGAMGMVIRRGRKPQNCEAPA